MRKLTKVLALTLASSMALSLAACGGSSSSSAGTAASGSTAASSATSSAGTQDGVVAEAFVDEAGIEHPAGLPLDYPSKDITYICPFAAGGTYDVWFRVLAEKVKEMEDWDHSFVVEYKEGASGDVGWTALYNSEPDGYTIGFFPTAALINGVSSGRPYSTEGVDNVMGMMADPGVIGVAAIFLGGLLIHGLAPGSQLFTTHAESAYGLLFGLLLAQFFILLFGFFGAPLYSRITRVPSNVLIPVIAVLCVLGAYSYRKLAFDMFVALFFGIVGYYMSKANIPMAPFVLAFVLGGQCKISWRRAWMLMKNDFVGYWAHPLPLALLAIDLFMLIWPFLPSKKNKKSETPTV